MVDGKRLKREIMQLTYNGQYSGQNNFTYTTVKIIKRNIGNLLPVIFPYRFESSNRYSIPVRITERNQFLPSNNVNTHCINNCIRIHLNKIRSADNKSSSEYVAECKIAS